MFCYMLSRYLNHYLSEAMLFIVDEHLKTLENNVFAIRIDDGTDYMYYFSSGSLNKLIDDISQHIANNQRHFSGKNLLSDINVVRHGEQSFSVHLNKKEVARLRLSFPLRALLHAGWECNFRMLADRRSSWFQVEPRNKPGRSAPQLFTKDFGGKCLSRRRTR